MFDNVVIMFTVECCGSDVQAFQLHTAS